MNITQKRQRLHSRRSVVYTTASLAVADSTPQDIEGQIGSRNGGPPKIIKSLTGMFRKEHAIRSSKHDLQVRFSWPLSFSTLRFYHMMLWRRSLSLPSLSSMRGRQAIQNQARTANSDLRVEAHHDGRVCIVLPAFRTFCSELASPHLSLQ